ncbi:hypothetical protein HK102_001598, partial [Quaeritorhiza haematococci]
PNLDPAENAIEMALQGSKDVPVIHYIKMKILSKRNVQSHLIEEGELFEIVRSKKMTRRPGKCTQPKLGGTPDAIFCFFAFEWGTVRVAEWPHLSLADCSRWSTSWRDIQATINALDELITKVGSTNSMTKTELLNKLIVTKLYLLSTSEDEAMVQKIVTLVNEQGTGLGKTGSEACQLVLWQAGDRAFQDHQHHAAIKWYEMCFQFFGSESADIRNTAILHRKIAMCYLELGRLEEARKSCANAQVLEQDSTATQLLLALICLEGEAIDETLEHIKTLNDPSQFGMLVALGSAAFKKGTTGAKRVLKGILAQILRVMGQEPSADDIKLHVLVIFRCLIRLTQSITTSLKELCGYIESAGVCLKELSHHLDQREEFTKELNWLFAVSWNTAVTATSSGDNAASCRLWEAVVKLVELFPNSSAMLHLQQKKVGLFAALASQVSIARDATTSDPWKKAEGIVNQLHKVFDEIKSINGGMNPASDPALEHVTYLEFEVKVGLQKWNELDVVLEYAESISAPTYVYERMVDIVIRQQSPSAGQCTRRFPLLALCFNLDSTPSARNYQYVNLTFLTSLSPVIFVTVQASLDVMLKRDSDLDLAKFSQWFRLLIQAGLIANKSGSFQLFRQVLALIKSRNQQVCLWDPSIPPPNCERPRPRTWF